MEVIDHIGNLIDASGDAAEPAGSELAIRHCERLRGSKSLTAKESTLLDYFEANAWSQLRPSPEAGPAEAWKWKDGCLTTKSGCCGGQFGQKDFRS